VVFYIIIVGKFTHAKVVVIISANNLINIYFIVMYKTNIP